MRWFLMVFIICGFVFTQLIAQITIHIESISDNTPEDASIYFAGNINGWNPGDADFELKLKPDGDYWIDLPAGNGLIEFKFTRGSWESVENNGNGGFRPNRTYTYGNGDTLELDILGWEDLDSGGGENSTANDQVMIWDEAMYMPQLDRTRRIWVYLPQDYTSSNSFYPVLYMQDGQNVFDASTSFAGEWKVDESLTQLENLGFGSVIVVAIDNGGSHRIDEYSPFVNDQYGGGEGDKYLDFIIQSLKPRVDSTFRTLQGPENTGIMGSSMGGLLAHYAYFRNPEVFGKAGIFSPAYWFSGEYFSYTENRGKIGSPRLFLLAGAKEPNISSGTESMNETLVGLGFSEDELKMRISPDGEHSEWFWAREFKNAFMWLFNPEVMMGTKSSESTGILIFPNPAKDSITIRGEGRMDLKIFTIEGEILLEKTIIDEGIIDLKPVQNNMQLIIRIDQAAKTSVYQIINLKC